MKTTIVSALAIFAFAAFSGQVAFPLEWNVRYQVKVPYEFEIIPEKLGVPKDSGFDVIATTPSGERRLEVASEAGRAPGSVLLRFRVPEGTTALRAEAKKGSNAPIGDTDNAFAGVLADPSGWVIPKNAKCEPCKGGLRFTGTPEGTVWAKRTVELTDDFAGAGVMQEFDVANRSQLVWGGRVKVVPLDAEGKALPETAVDPRWTDHMRPKDRVIAYRDAGQMHPRAKKARIEVELHPLKVKHDAYGYPLADPDAACTPVLELTRAVLRPAVRLAFPKWNDACFGEGVSGSAGDTSLRLGGKDRRAVFYQTNPRSAWTEKVQSRNEEDRFFPAGDGTVEAWFKPDWQSVPSDQRGKEVKLFQAYLYEQKNNRAGEKVALGYIPANGTMTVRLCDWAGHAFSGRLEKAAMPSGRWTHVALEWSCGKEARMYLDGKRVYTLPIPGFEATPIADRSHKEPNDLWATEFYLGTAFDEMRLAKDFKADKHPYYEGLVDEFRASTGCRYGGDFTPGKDAVVDAATRALFKFDRAFDGVSGGGFGHIPACVHAMRDRVSHRVGDVQYFPEELLAENDPRKVFTIMNYPEMPETGDYLRARTRLTKGFDVKAGGRINVECGKRVFMDYVEISNENGVSPVRYPIVVNRGNLDPRSFGDLSDSLGIQGLSDREKANRVFQYMLASSDYFMNHQACFAPGEDESRQGCYEAMIMLNSYCGFECGPLNNMTANMFSTVAGCPASMTQGYGHLFEQVFYDGKNHIYDLSAQKFFPAMDNETAAYLEEAGDQAAVNKRVGGSSDHFIRRSSRGRSAHDPCYQEKRAMILNPGEKLRIRWANDGTMNNLLTWGRTGVAYRIFTPNEPDYAAFAGADDAKMEIRRKDRVFPQYSTGTLTFDGRPSLDNPAFERSGDGAFVYRVRSSYPIVWGEYRAELADGRGAAPLEISTDFKKFRPLPASADGTSRLEYLVKARHEYLIRVKSPIAGIRRFSACTKLEVNTRTYPGWLRPGANELTFKAEDGARAKVTFAWREEADHDIVIGGGGYQGCIPGFERQLVLVDPSKPLVLKVDGVGPGAKAVAVGALKAELQGGKLTLTAAADLPQMLAAGDDRPGVTTRKSYFAGVEIRDGKAVKLLTVLVSPDARLVTAAEMRATGGGTFRKADGASCQDRIEITGSEAKISVPFAKLPAGRYGVYTLTRCVGGQPKAVSALRMSDPSNPKESHWLMKQIDGNLDYLKAGYGKPGGRGRWRWDTNTNLPEQSSYSGWRMRTWEFGEFDHLDISGGAREGEPVEFAALLILPEPEFEFANELRHVLFGLNCDPISSAD